MIYLQYLSRYIHIGILNFLESCKSFNAKIPFLPSPILDHHKKIFFETIKVDLNKQSKLLELFFYYYYLFILGTRLSKKNVMPANGRYIVLEN